MVLVLPFQNRRIVVDLVEDVRLPSLPDLADVLQTNSVLPGLRAATGEDVVVGINMGTADQLQALRVQLVLPGIEMVRFEEARPAQVITFTFCKL